MSTRHHRNKPLQRDLVLLIDHLNIGNLRQLRLSLPHLVDLAAIKVEISKCVPVVDLGLVVEEGHALHLELLAVAGEDVLFELQAGFALVDHQVYLFVIY